jgi:hypothetical protein
MTRQWLLRFMRITQLALTVAGVLLLFIGPAVLGVVAVAVGVSAFVVSRTGWYQDIYFERPAVRAQMQHAPRVRAHPLRATRSRVDPRGAKARVPRSASR